MDFPVDPSRYIAFMSITAAMAMTPGPANIFAIATGMGKGKRAALWGVTGLNAATLIWFLAAALGLGALVVAFPNFFSLLRYVSVFYIVWLAFEQFRTVYARNIAPIAKIKVSKRTPFYDGFIVQITNPKALLFFTGVLPSFFDVNKPVLAQMLMFAIPTIGFDIISMSAYGLGGAALKKRAEDSRFRRGFALAVGLLLLTAAALIVVES